MNKDSFSENNNAPKVPNGKKCSWKKIFSVSAVVLSIAAITLIFFWPRSVTYKIGNIDPRFKISDSDVLQVVNDSAERWNKAAQKELLKYSPSGEVTVDFVFDYRQEYLNAKKEIEKEYSFLPAEKNALDYELQSINNQNTQLSYESEELDLETDKLNEDVSAYNSKVNYWNRSGGAPTYVYSELENERKELNTRKSQIQAKLQELKGREKTLDNETDKYNAEVDAYNKKVNEEKVKMDSIYDQFLKNQNYSAETELGEFSGSVITIYAFDDSESLRLVLMHEFGHALGAEHAQNKSSVMFPLLNDISIDKTNPYPSAEDLELIGRH